MILNMPTIYIINNVTGETKEWEMKEENEIPSEIQPERKTRKPSKETKDASQTES